jgi:hypothetical protein
MKGRLLHCTRIEEIDEQGGRLETTSMMWYQLPRSKDSSWVQVISTDFEYYREPSKRKEMDKWYVITLHIEYAESAEATPIVVVHTHRHNFPSMVFDNHDSRIVGRARSAHWSKKLSKLTREIRDLAWYAQKRRQHTYLRSLMAPHEQVRRFMGKK